MDELTLAVVGIDFANTDKSKSNRRFELMACNPGDRVELVLEPQNKHDENAVAVFSVRGACAAASSFVNGHILYVDGGITASL